MTRLFIVTLFIQLICRAHHADCLARWVTSWNLDCQEKYQQPQICKWYHFNGRKGRGTRPLDERGKWKWKQLSCVHSLRLHGLNSLEFSKPQQIEGERWKQWQISSSLGLKSLWMMTCSHEIRRLFLNRKSMTILDNVLKSKDITLPTKVRIVKAIVFPVVMYGYKS